MKYGPAKSTTCLRASVIVWVENTMSGGPRHRSGGFGDRVGGEHHVGLAAGEQGLPVARIGLHPGDPGFRNAQRLGDVLRRLDVEAAVGVAVLEPESGLVERDADGDLVELGRTRNLGGLFVRPL